MVYYNIYKPINSINITGGVLSEGDPSSKVARQTTSVPLYTEMAGMVSVSTNVPSLSLIELAMTSAYRLLEVPLISQLYKASCRSWRHRNKTFWFSDTLTVTDEGTSAKSIGGGGGGGHGHNLGRPRNGRQLPFIIMTMCYYYMSMYVHSVRQDLFNNCYEKNC